MNFIRPCRLYLPSAAGQFHSGKQRTLTFRRRVYFFTRRNINSQLKEDRMLLRRLCLHLRRAAKGNERRKTNKALFVLAGGQGGQLGHSARVSSSITNVQMLAWIDLPNACPGAMLIERPQRRRESSEGGRKEGRKVRK